MKIFRILFCAVIFIILCQSCHVGRFFVYNFADHKDYKKFPTRDIQAPSETFYFKKSARKYPVLVNKDKWDSFEQLLEKNKTLGFAIIKNDTLLYDWYRDKYDTSSVFTSFSVAKSFVSVLIGIAIDEGLIPNTNQPITNYISELTTEGFSKITIQHLLDMQSGIEFNESYINPFGHAAKYYYGKHLLKYIKKLKIAKEPGLGFNYRSVDSQLLGIILERATGKTLSAYLQEKIWGPLQMEYDGSWNIDSKSGATEKAFCCLNARVMDFAKLGRLMLNNGKWEGKQVVSESWVKASIAPNDKGYSNQWWLFETPEIAFMAEGILGQFIYVNPATNTIIVRTGKNYGDISWRAIFNSLSQLIENRPLKSLPK